MTMYQIERNHIISNQCFLPRIKDTLKLRGRYLCRPVIFHSMYLTCELRVLGRQSITGGAICPDQILTMSLLSSIFGSSSGDKSASSSTELFAKVSIPSSLHKKSSAPPSKKDDKKSKKEDDKDDSSSSSSGDSESSTKEQSTTQSTTEETTTTKSISKPTKEQLKQESERTIFVGNLPVDITRKALASIFKPCGTVLSTRLRSVAVSGVKLPPEQAGNQVCAYHVCISLHIYYVCI